MRKLFKKFNQQESRMLQSRNVNEIMQKHIKLSNKKFLNYLIISYPKIDIVLQKKFHKQYIKNISKVYYSN
ncbi:unnamed protein product [Paramecium primaurelia]|uniref:Uncharacterized protein n=1 Tax=Paramecium primaurelia TaxID=5886 RepID=A0A8S1KHP5_PARPR|nr:unnamed protein product [Paramecium primaurelia]